MGVSSRTKDNYKRARNLVKQLKGVDSNLDKIVNEIATTNEVSNTYWTKIMRAIRKEYETARRISANWTNKNIPKSYRDAIASQMKNITQKQIPVKKPTIGTIAGKDRSRQSLFSLISETNSSFIYGYNGGEVTMQRIANLTKQINVQEKIIDRAISEGFIEEGTARSSIKRLQKELLKKAQDGKYITVIDKNGKPRSYKVNTYSELVARTKLQEASTQGVLDTATTVGADLVQVSSHNTKTAYDAQFEGKIYSLTGNDKEFPTADDLPPFHPNCLHTINIVFREALEHNGTLQKQIDFSQGRTEIHPTRKGHVPVSQRGKENAT